MIARGSSIDIRIIIRRWYALQCRQAVRLWHDDVGMTSQLGHTNITYILRVSYVYVTYILRISYVNDGSAVVHIMRAVTHTN